MCACLPTLKHFVQAIAPSFLGSSRSGGKSGYTAGAYGSSTVRTGPRTGALSGNFTGSRSRPRRDDYTGFDGEEEWRMQTLVEGNSSKDPDTTVRSRNDSDGDKDGDDDSAKGIIQTRTVQIQYEDRPV
jgi:hypothetical protein